MYANPKGFRLHYRPRSGERFAMELPIPARKPGQPTRFVGFGAMATAPSNIAAAEFGGEPARVVDLGVLGQYRPRPVREKRPDGSRGPQLPVTRGRALERPPIDVEADALRLVERALVDGEFIHRGRRVRVLVCPTGAVRTIPDKGAALRWADAATLAAAIACGAF